MLLSLIESVVFCSTFGQMVIAALPDAETAGNVVTLLFSMMLTFNGVLPVPGVLPGKLLHPSIARFSLQCNLSRSWNNELKWSPSRLLDLHVSRLANDMPHRRLGGTSLSQRQVHCARNELAIFDPPAGQNCSSYLSQYFEMGTLGQLSNPSATSGCEYCSIIDGAQYLAGSQIDAKDAWRNFGLFWVYIVFNVFATILLYYILRVKKFSLEKPKDLLAKFSTGRE